MFGVRVLERDKSTGQLSRPATYAYFRLSDKGDLLDLNRLPVKIENYEPTRGWGSQNADDNVLINGHIVVSKAKLVKNGAKFKK